MLSVLLVLGWVLVSCVFLKGVLWCEAFCVFCVLTVFSLGLIYSFGWVSSDLVFSLDSLSGSLVVLSIWISGLMLLASIRVWSNKVSSDVFVVLVLSLCIILVSCFCVSDSFSFYLLFEASLVPTLFLILGWGYQPERLQAGFYMIFYTVSASLPLLLIVLFEMIVSGHCCFFFSWESYFLGSFYSLVFWCCLILAFLVKLPVFFVHLWLPKAHVEAPVAGSMVLAAVLLKLGGFGLMRFSSLFPFLMVFFSKEFVSFILWGSVVTSLICLRQTDVKSLIAYSSVGHMGLFTAGVLSGSVWGWQGGLLMMLAHGLCSSGLFSMANLSYEAVGSRSAYLSKGAMAFFPSLAFWWFLFCVANMAAPPFLSLPAEILLISSVVNMSSTTFLVVGCLSFFSGGYSLYLFTSLQHGKSLSSYITVYGQYVGSYVCCLFHIFPLALLFLKLSLFCVF